MESNAAKSLTGLPPKVVFQLSQEMALRTERGSDRGRARHFPLQGFWCSDLTDVPDNELPTEP